MFPQSHPVFVGQQGGSQFSGRTPGVEYQRPSVSPTSSTSSSIPTNPHQSQSGPYDIVCAKCWHQQQLYFPYPPPAASINTTTHGPYPPSSYPQHHQQPQQRQAAPQQLPEYNVYRTFHPPPAPHNPSLPKQPVSANPTPQQSLQQQQGLPAIKQEPQSPTSQNRSHQPHQQQQHPHPQSTPISHPSSHQSGIQHSILPRPIHTPLDAKAAHLPDPSQVMVTMSQSAYMNIISRLSRLEERYTLETSQKATWHQSTQILAYEYHKLAERFCTLEEEMGELLERLDDNDERLEDVETEQERGRRRWSAQRQVRRPDSGYGPTPPREVSGDGDAIMAEAAVIVKKEPGTSSSDQPLSSPGRKRSRSDAQEGAASFSKKRRDS
ncbi:hypothetical protein BJ508DRAFT_411104 [Ascobolus immersus RN42]|uniref:Uncharacterized protein n=1 Tax=Ascobolus immersus RN42 TaxID=1160509 RepID=A0A3N4IMM6_ASCIM|nr:hypothetical protein BJ508DRAFT_411104 [Ascobolus immersus RN42]